MEQNVKAVSNFNDVNTDTVYEPVPKHKPDIPREPCAARFMGFVQMKMFRKHKHDSYERFIHRKLCDFSPTKYKRAVTASEISFLIDTCEWCSTLWFRLCDGSNFHENKAYLDYLVLAAREWRIIFTYRFTYPVKCAAINKTKTSAETRRGELSKTRVLRESNVFIRMILFLRLPVHGVITWKL